MMMSPSPPPTTREELHTNRTNNIDNMQRPLPTIYEGSVESMSVGRIFVPPEETAASHPAFPAATHGESPALESMSEDFHDEEALSDPQGISPCFNKHTTTPRRLSAQAIDLRPKPPTRFWLWAVLAVAIGAGVGIAIVTVMTSNNDSNDDNRANVAATDNSSPDTAPSNNGTDATTTPTAAPMLSTEDPSTQSPSTMGTTIETIPGVIFGLQNNSIVVDGPSNSGRQTTSPTSSSASPSVSPTTSASPSVEPTSCWETPEPRQRPEAGEIELGGTTYGVWVNQDVGMGCRNVSTIAAHLTCADEGSIVVGIAPNSSVDCVYENASYAFCTSLETSLFFLGVACYGGSRELNVTAAPASAQCAPPGGNLVTQIIFREYCSARDVTSRPPLCLLESDTVRDEDSVPNRCFANDQCTSTLDDAGCFLQAQAGLVARPSVGPPCSGTLTHRAAGRVCTSPGHCADHVCYEGICRADPAATVTCPCASHLDCASGTCRDGQCQAAADEGAKLVQDELAALEEDGTMLASTPQRQSFVPYP